MISSSFQYDQSAARLNVVGVPDVSVGQKQGVIGIISSWSLNLVSFPLLDGKLEHLLALMSVIIPYARYRVSGINHTFGLDTDPVSIMKVSAGHKLRLVSSKPDVEPLEILLDDAELSDLVACLDQLRFDTRVKINWNVPKSVPLLSKEKGRNVSFISKSFYFLVGNSLVVLSSLLFFYLPIPINESKLPKPNTSLLISK